jgi:putative nucleotidyltransferase with HDIG domain
MPQILLKLIEHCQADEAGMSELAQLVAKDAAMASKIIGVANSSAYPNRGRLVGLEQSLISLGTDMVKTLLISESVFQIFGDFSQPSGVDLRGFWKHSLTAAVAARMLAAKTGYPHLEEAYLAGLLHDVGRLALFASAPREYGVNFFAADDESLCAVEQRTLQITHAEAGAWIIERWNLDSFLADSVLYHHEPLARLENAHPLIRTVCVAHLLAAGCGDVPTLEAAAALCGLAPADLTLIHSRASDEVKKTAEYLGIQLAGADQIQASTAPATPAPAPDSAKEKLGEQVRNMVLASEAGRTFAQQQNEPGLLDSVMHSARMLFGFADLTVLLLDGASIALRGTPIGEQRQRLAAFSIPLKGGGAIAEAVVARRLIFITPDGGLPGVAEEQLLRVLGADCLVCVPLVAEERCLGVLVGGISAWQLEDFRRREGFLRAFASQVGSALKTVLNERGKADRRATSVAEEYREASRRVAHEVSNPLSIIKNYLSVLDRKLARQEMVNGEMSILNEEIDRVSQIVNGLADLQPVPREGATEVNRIVGDVTRLFRDTEYIPATVRITTRLQDQPFEVDADADTLKQILVNLIKNAVEALPTGGEIEVANHGLVNRDGLLYVELSIRDSGAGIPAEVMANLFKPVRSSKGDGHRGLGLSIVHSLVKRVNGLIACRSGKQGTTFDILLPFRSGAERAPGANPPAGNSV